MGYREEYIGKPIDLRNMFNRSIFNSLWYIISGKRYKNADPKITKMVSLITGLVFYIY